MEKQLMQWTDIVFEPNATVELQVKEPLKPGIYLLKIASANSSYTAKMIHIL
jgi:hypothetical protein